MSFYREFTVIAFCCIQFVFPPPVYAKAKLASIFSNGMVLQRDQRIPVWGKASAEEKITLRLKKQVIHVVADKNGNFRSDFNAEPSGGPYNLVVESSQKEVINEVYIGEVWLCVGQSNMVMAVEETSDVEKFLSNRNQNLHLLHMPPSPTAKASEGFSAKWQACDEENVRHFSAIAYGFGSKIANDLNLPVGIICGAVGGTPIDAWTPNLEEDQSSESGERSENCKNSQCFNGILHPLIPYAIRGIVWYQGEADLGTPKSYARKFPSLIEKLRDLWAQEDDDFPFIFVQLPRNNVLSKELGNFVWADFRLAQESATQLRNVFMVSAIDIGEPDDIHPKSKFILSERLAVTALAHCYSKKYMYKGPTVKNMQIVDGDRVKITFDCNIDDLRIRGDGGFTIASVGGAFMPCKVTRRENSLIVYSDEIKRPVRLRYAYANVPAGLIISKYGFPLPPFNHEFLEQLDSIR